MYFVCLVCIRVFLKSNDNFVILLKEREKERKKKKKERRSKWWARKKKRKKKKFSFVSRSHDFQLISKKTT